MKLLLIRHAESQGNVDKTIHQTLADQQIPLSKRGYEQASETGKILEDWFDNHPSNLVKLWTSPYVRTRQTTQQILNNMGDHGRYLRTSKYVHEHFLIGEQQYGLFDGIPDEDWVTHFPLEHGHYQKHLNAQGKFWAPMPMGESRFNVAVRCHQFLMTLDKDFTHIIVSHAITIRALIMAHLNKSPEWIDNEKCPNNCSIRLIDNNFDCGYIFEGFKK